MDKTGHPKATQPWLITKVTGSETSSEQDSLISEVPLEVIIVQQKDGHKKREPLFVTMRTPGDDFDMVRGFLFTEGIIRTHEDILSMKYDDDRNEPEFQGNRLMVYLDSKSYMDLSSLNRHFFSSSSCGFCGKKSIDNLATESGFITPSNKGLIGPNTLSRIFNEFNNIPSYFKETGGNHMVAVHDQNGDMLESREDVGRHNAMDKVIGSLLKRRQPPFHDLVVCVSGRASFELMQKAHMAGFSIFAAIGAPSDLAVELADSSGITLVGFLKDHQYNIYTHPERINL